MLIQAKVFLVFDRLNCKLKVNQFPDPLTERRDLYGVITGRSVGYVAKGNPVM